MKRMIMRLSLIGLVFIVGLVFCSSTIVFAQQGSESSEASSPKPQKPKKNLQSDLKISPPQPFLEA